MESKERKVISVQDILLSTKEVFETENPSEVLEKLQTGAWIATSAYWQNGAVRFAMNRIS